MNVLIVSGFLGAGKTTFIRELLQRTDALTAVLENEFGGDTLDGDSVRSDMTGELLEFAEGCVCCGLKDAFANTVLAISSGLDPEVLVVEPTGIALLSNVLAQVRRVSYSKIRLAAPVAIVSPGHVAQYLRAYPDVFTDQILHAERIIFSKTEQTDTALIADAKQRIRAINGRAKLYDTPYRDLPADWWNSLLRAADISGTDSGTEKEKEGTDTTHPFEHLTLRGVRLHSIEALVLLLEDCIHGSFGEVVRAKGCLIAGAERIRFDLADGAYALTAAENDQRSEQAVFIGCFLDKQRISARFQKRIRPVRIAKPRKEKI